MAVALPERAKLAAGSVVPDAEGLGSVTPHPHGGGGLLRRGYQWAHLRVPGSAATQPAVGSWATAHGAERVFFWILAAGTDCA